MSIGNIEAILRAKSVLPIAVGPIRQIIVGGFSSLRSNYLFTDKGVFVMIAQS